MSNRGMVCVFEGPDGVGKTTVVEAVRERLAAEGLPVVALSFPGRFEGSIGAHVHELHHRPKKFNVLTMTPGALQILHVAAHVDTIQSRIRPHVEEGCIVLLDRYWWSTWVYGQIGGVSAEALEMMIELERHYWLDLEPQVVFLMSRDAKHFPESRRASFLREMEEYRSLAAQRWNETRVVNLPNQGSVSATAEVGVGVIQVLLGDRARPLLSNGSVTKGLDYTEAPRTAAGQLPFNWLEEAATLAPRINVTVWHRPTPPRPTPVFDTYWRFAAERQAIFHRRLHNQPPPWTKDPILGRYKFTNVYRASDRVSQYLIRHVIYAGDQGSREVFFRILLFKLFNRIDTWKHLCSELGELRASTFNAERYGKSLTRLLASGGPLYSGAYIMPTGGKQWHQDRKHRMHLLLLEHMLSEQLPERLEQANNMKEAFELLKGMPTIGSFLAYQYVIDLNYSTLTDFGEDQFVSPGPGARDGIRKCFTSLGGLTEQDLIRMVCDRQQEEFSLRGLPFEPLWGRPLQLIDCQNVFCEVDKYARVYHPEVKGKSGRSRIKQEFRPSEVPIEYWYPPKWGLNERIAATRDQAVIGTDSLIKGHDSVHY